MHGSLKMVAVQVKVLSGGEDEGWVLLTLGGDTVT